MVGSFLRLAAAAIFCIALAGCASGPDYADRDDGGSRPVGRARPDAPLQCVPYARDHSRVTLYGDAYTWWDKAAGKFARSPVPSEGAVMVLTNYAGPNRGHVAVVRAILDSRTIKIDHANWLDDGAIYVDDPVRDVSTENDWSQVRVFNLRTGAWGGHIYPVQGFIGPGPDSRDGPRDWHVAQNPPRVQHDANGGDAPRDWHVAQNPAAVQHDAISVLLGDNELTDEEKGN
jgi:surface antigen